MQFPFPRKVFIMPQALIPLSLADEQLLQTLTAVVRQRYPGAIVISAEYDITNDAMLASVLHPSFPLSTYAAPKEAWETETHDYQEPIPCASE